MDQKLEDSRTMPLGNFNLKHSIAFLKHSKLVVPQLFDNKVIFLAGGVPQTELRELQSKASGVFINRGESSERGARGRLQTKEAGQQQGRGDCTGR